MRLRFRTWPYLVATVTLLAWASFGAYWLSNAHRVELSYQLETPARDALMARADRWEDFFIASTWYLAMGSILPLLVQLVTWPKLWRENYEYGLARWAMVVATPLALVLLALLVLAAAVSVGGGMIG